MCCGQTDSPHLHIHHVWPLRDSRYPAGFGLRGPSLYRSIALYAEQHGAPPEGFELLCEGAHRRVWNRGGSGIHLCPKRQVSHLDCARTGGKSRT